MESNIETKIIGVPVKEEQKPKVNEQGVEENIETKKKTRKVRTKDKIYCPYCNLETVLIWVHGHYQCGRCKNVVTGCCE
jgi:hypothetical protein